MTTDTACPDCGRTSDDHVLLSDGLLRCRTCGCEFEADPTDDGFDCGYDGIAEYYSIHSDHRDPDDV